MIIFKDKFTFKLDYHNGGNLVLDVSNNRLNINTIQVYRHFKEDYQVNVNFQKKNSFYIPLNKSYLSFLAPNGTGKTLLLKSFYEFFINYDNEVRNQRDEERFTTSDNYALFSKYVMLKTDFKINKSSNIIHLFSLNNVYNNKYDYLLLPHLEYVLKKINLITVFNQYSNQKNLNRKINNFLSKTNIYITNHKISYGESLTSMINSSLIYDEIKEAPKNLLSAILYILEKLALENNMPINKILTMKNKKNLNWEILNKIFNNTKYTGNDILILQNSFVKFLNFSFTEKKLKFKIADFILKAIKDFKNNDNIYDNFKNEFYKFNQFMIKSIKNNQISINSNYKIEIKKYYLDLFDTNIYFPNKIIINKIEKCIGDFKDEYNYNDPTSVRSIFSLIEKNGSEHEKISYKNLCAELFITYLKFKIKNKKEHILIISDDIFTQTDNHNVLINLININNCLIKTKLEKTTTWINLTHSFSYFQSFNKCLNVDYENIYFMKKLSNELYISALKIKSKFFVEYLNKQITTNVTNYEKIIPIFTKLMYERFIEEHNENDDNLKNLITDFLHYFPDDLNIKIETSIASKTKAIQELLKILNGNNSYHELFNIMDKVFMSKINADITDIELGFFYSIYIRFLIEKYISKYLNDSSINKTNNYTGNLLNKLKTKNSKIYSKVTAIYNLTKNYIHHDYINYEYLIFLNPQDYKNQILQLRKTLLKI